MWFLENIQRLQKERREINVLLNEVNWLFDAHWKFFNAKLCFFATIQVYRHPYPIKLVYPNAFPSNPPSVFPRESNQRWSGHQYGAGGELCLEWGSDNWQEKITGADILRSAYKLLQIEYQDIGQEPRVEAPSRHFLTLGQEVRSSTLRFICNYSLLDFLSSNPQQESGLLKIKLLSYLPTLTTFILRLEGQSGEKWENSKLTSGLGKRALDFDGRFFRTNMDSTSIENLKTESIVDLLNQHHITDVVSLGLPQFFLLLSGTGDDLQLYWLYGDKKLYHFQTITVNDDIFHDRLSPDFERLSNKSVGLVGLGSAGSKIAISLARSGVQEFYLVDHDIFLPENICRHELNWEYIGQHKVDAIKDKIGLISNEIEVSTSRLMLSGQEASANIDSTLTKLGECDVIIDATADPSVFNQLSSVTSQYEKPLLWLEVFAGGIGGFLARFRPGIDPDPKVMRASYLNYLKNRHETFPKTAANYSAITEEGTPIVATDADVGVIASFSTQMVLDLLLERVPSNFPYSMYLIGMSREWLFKEAFYTIPFDMSEVQPNTPVNELDDIDMIEAFDFIKELIEKHDNNENPPS